VLVTSAVSGEGKTHTCINLALSLAMEKGPHRAAGGRRCAEAAHQPPVRRCGPARPDGGAGDEATASGPVIRTDIESLRILPAGRWNLHATELLASERMLKLCRELANRYPDRIVIFDSPPLLAATEAQAIAAAVGQVVLVVAEGLTARESVREAIALIDDQKPVNAILNKSRRGTGGNYYGSYYRGYGDTREETKGRAS
jgi:protein-tyrosine kinase